MEQINLDRYVNISIVPGNSQMKRELIEVKNNVQTETVWV